MRRKVAIKSGEYCKVLPFSIPSPGGGRADANFLPPAKLAQCAGPTVAAVKSLEKHYPTWKDLKGSFVKVIRTHEMGFEHLCIVECQKHKFIFRIHVNMLSEKLNICKCPTRMLLNRGCNCGGV